MMILRSLFLFAIAVGLVTNTIAFVRDSKIIHERWNAALRHVFAIAIGWIACGMLSGTLVLLDLLEIDKFSFTALASSLFVPLVIFVMGMIVLRVLLKHSSK